MIEIISVSKIRYIINQLPQEHQEWLKIGSRLGRTVYTCKCNKDGKWFAIEFKVESISIRGDVIIYHSFRAGETESENIFDTLQQAEAECTKRQEALDQIIRENEERKSKYPDETEYIWQECKAMHSRCINDLEACISQRKYRYDRLKEPADNVSTPEEFKEFLAITLRQLHHALRDRDRELVTLGLLPPENKPTGSIYDKIHSRYKEFYREPNSEEGKSIAEQHKLDLVREVKIAIVCLKCGCGQFAPVEGLLSGNWDGICENCSSQPHKPNT